MRLLYTKNIGETMGKRKRFKKKRNETEYEKKIVKDYRMDDTDGQRKCEQERLKDYFEDNEQRRMTRLGAVLAIVAVVGTICTVIFRLCINMLSMWAIEGVVYRCLQIAIFATFSIIIILFYRLIIFIIYDLMRYNVSDENCRKYDIRSDESYHLFVCDCRVYLSLLTAMLMIIIIFFGLNGDKPDQVIGISLAIIFLAFVVGAIYWSVKKLRKKIPLYIREVVPKVGIWILVGCVSFCIALVVLVDHKGEIRIEFESNGDVDICNSSSIDPDNIIVTIYDENDNVICDRYITCEDMIYAIERVDIYEERDGVKVTDVMMINTEQQHWRYWFNLSDIAKKRGKYRIFIQIEVGRKLVKVENYIIKELNGFRYTVSNITKTY